MSQRQCPWCGRLGARVSDSELREAHAQPHADGSTCVCRHVTTGSAQPRRSDAELEALGVEVES